MTLIAGFADPVAGAQAAFRAVLTAMSRPGTILPAAAPAPAPLDPATAAVLLTLLDAETPCWLDPACAPARDWLAFHCGAPLAGRGDAAFAVACDMPDLSGLSAGSDEAPEAGATLILQVRTLGSGRRLHLSGPGIAAVAHLDVAGLPHDFVAQWGKNHAQFPRGVDLILCAGDRIAALPRTVAIA